MGLKTRRYSGPEIKMRVGIISDTHGLLRPEAEQALDGVDAIVHAGDIGRLEVLEKLKRIAPVFAVRGNVDTDEWARNLPLTTVVELGGVTFYVLHDLQELDLKPEAAGFDFVVSGHSHRAEHSERHGVRYVNPGSAGPKRFRLPVTLGSVDLGKRPWKVEIVALAV
jgi:putative phosphoesterase